VNVTKTCSVRYSPILKAVLAQRSLLFHYFHNHMGHGHSTHFIYNIRKQLHTSAAHKASFGRCPSSQAKKHNVSENGPHL
jgi:hypothetical protein